MLKPSASSLATRDDTKPTDNSVGAVSVTSRVADASVSPQPPPLDVSRILSFTSSPEYEEDPGEECVPVGEDMGS